MLTMPLSARTEGARPCHLSMPRRRRAGRQTQPPSASHGTTGIRIARNCLVCAAQLVDQGAHRGGHAGDETSRSVRSGPRRRTGAAQRRWRPPRANAGDRVGFTRHHHGCRSCPDPRPVPPSPARWPRVQGPGVIASRMSSWAASSSSFTVIPSRCRCRCRHGAAGDAGVGQDFDVAVGQALLISAAERLLGDHLPAGSAFSLPRLEAVVVRGFLRPHRVPVMIAVLMPRPPAVAGGGQTVGPVRKQSQVLRRDRRFEPVGDPLNCEPRHPARARAWERR